MSFDTDEKSAEDSRPREFYEITIGDPVVTTYRIASGARDLVVTINSVPNVHFPASAVARSEISPSSSSRPKELSLMLPVTHPLAKRWALLGSPPYKVTVTVRRLQVTSGEIETLWVGRIHSMNVDNSVAKFRVPSRASEMFLKVIPTVTAGRECPHILYDSMCRVLRTGSGPGGLAHKVTTTVQSVNGREVFTNLLSTDRQGTWALNGELLHLATGERQTIRRAAAQGDSIEVYAGCPKTIDICQSRFANKNNFGGFNRMPTKNLWSPVDDHGAGSISAVGELP
jgi:hypothetical protein